MRVVTGPLSFHPAHAMISELQSASTALNATQQVLVCHLVSIKRLGTMLHLIIL